MKINLDSEILDLLMPDCRDEDVKPHIKVKEILLEYYSTKKVEDGSKNERLSCKK
jgi:hypothetical protein